MVLPPIEPVTRLGMKTIGVFLFTVSWWLAVGVGFPSLVCIALVAATGVMTSKEVFALSWGSYLILFVIGALYGLFEGFFVKGKGDRKGSALAFF